MDFSPPRVSRVERTSGEQTFDTLFKRIQPFGCPSNIAKPIRPSDLGSGGQYNRRKKKKMSSQVVKNWKARAKQIALKCD